MERGSTLWEDLFRLGMLVGWNGIGWNTLGATLWLVGVPLDRETVHSEEGRMCGIMMGVSMHAAGWRVDGLLVFFMYPYLNEKYTVTRRNG